MCITICVHINPFCFRARVSINFNTYIGVLITTKVVAFDDQHLWHPLHAMIVGDAPMLRLELPVPARLQAGVRTLHVEVLQATGLPRVDTTLTENDVFALLVFEGHVLRTATRWDEDQPCWPADVPRAVAVIERLLEAEEVEGAAGVLELQPADQLRTVVVLCPGCAGECRRRFALRRERACYCSTYAPRRHV